MVAPLLGGGTAKYILIKQTYYLRCLKDDAN